MILNSLHSYYNGLSTGGYANSLPIQTLPDAKKTEAWKKNTMDRLEQIATNQIAKNLEFRDYYRMVEGRLVYSDFEAPPEILKDIVSIRQEMDLPTYIRHYDLIGIIANQLIGELDTNKDKLRIDSTDEYSENEYIRTKTEKINEYMQSKFQMEINTKLALKGINTDTNQEFKSEEEKQQYLQMLQQESNKIVSPEEIERNLNKNFKVKAAEWAEKTLESDNSNFNITHLEDQEFLDYFLTGRFFRHYHVGYDFYKPEHWEVETTFFSQDLGIKFPQDGEYVGRMTWLSASDLLSRYGEKLSHNLQKKIGKVFDHTTESGSGITGDYTNLNKRPVGSATVPHQDYFDHQLHLQLQDAFDTPLGVSTYIDKDGTEQSAPDWLSDYSTNQSYFGTNIAERLRDDIDVRRDLFKLTEAYWRSFKRVGYLRYESLSGVVVEELVTDDLLNDFIKENEIKKLNNISLEDFEEGDEVNVIAYFYIPEIWKGKKIGAASSLMSEDIYFDIGPMDFQIKGDSNIFDVKLPISGYISSSYARKIRPYQMGYNLCMNQIYNLLEKEIGMFFLLDINFLPSEFKDMGDSAEMLSELRDFARDLGFVPVDTSRQNLQGQNGQSQMFQKQDISYSAQIQSRGAMADMYKRLALEQIGITEQRKGTPNQYSTAEGIKVGQESSYAQTKNIYNKFNEARKKTTELHINIAQYCQGNNKDISTFSRKADGDIAFLAFNDDLFPLRRLGVSVISDAKSRQSLERLREFLLSNNTLGNDLLDFAEVMSSDSMIELVEIGKASRAKVQKELEAERAHESELVDKQIAGAAQESERIRIAEEKSKEKDRQARHEDERIKALGRASDKNSDVEGFAQINKAADLALKKQHQEADIELRQGDQALKKDAEISKQAIAQEGLKIKLAELKEKREARRDAKFIATINKN